MMNCAVSKNWAVRGRSVSCSQEKLTPGYSQEKPTLSCSQCSIYSSTYSKDAHYFKKSSGL